MSFLFKSSKKSSGSGSGTPSTALPPATREIRSSDGPGSQQSQIPTRNGATKPGSPSPGQKGSVSNSLSSIAESGSRSGSAPPQETKQAEFMRQNGGLAGDLGNGMAGGAGMGMSRQGALSPEQKTLRDKNQDQVSDTPPWPSESRRTWALLRMSSYANHVFSNWARGSRCNRADLHHKMPRPTHGRRNV